MSLEKFWLQLAQGRFQFFTCDLLCTCQIFLYFSLLLNNFQLTKLTRINFSRCMMEKILIVKAVQRGEIAPLQVQRYSYHLF